MTTAKIYKSQIFYIGNERLLALPKDIKLDATEVDIVQQAEQLIISIKSPKKPEPAQVDTTLKAMLDSWQPLGKDFDDAFEFDDLPIKN